MRAQNIGTDALIQQLVYAFGFIELSGLALYSLIKVAQWGVEVEAGITVSVGILFVIIGPLFFSYGLSWGVTVCGALLISRFTYLYWDRIGPLLKFLAPLVGITILGYITYRIIQSTQRG